MGKKLVIGIGCSWTQGEGGYTSRIWDKYGGRVNLPMNKSTHLIKMENQHSWVNVLCKKHFKDYEPVNLGQRGIGNRGAAKSLYLTNIDWDTVDDAILVYMLSGFERFDFFRQWPHDFRDVEKEHAVRHWFKDIGHYNFNTLWPHPNHNESWTAYAKEIYSEEQTAMETYTNIMEVQTFCKAHGFKFVLANAFDGRGRAELAEVAPTLVDHINWDNYIHTHTAYECFARLLVDLDGLVEYPGYMNFYRELKWPAKYLANCIHPTILGYEVIAEELAQFINYKWFDGPTIAARKTKRLIDA